ncbi:MAG: nicotinate phosphoribosyltransferase [Thermoplasmata archaeon]
MNAFHTASEEDIKKGKTTDVYFKNTMKILESKGIAYQHVAAEFTTTSLPENGEWGVFVGLEDIISLLEGKPLDLYAVPEGTLFKPRDHQGVLTPVMFIQGPYGEFCVYETPLLGFICHPSGIATKAARVKKCAGDAEIMSFGIRRMHPVIAPSIDRAAYIGGCDAISCIAGAEEVNVEPTGTMPHALTILFGSPKDAFQAFHEVLPENVPRIALVDTYHDETLETFMAHEAMEDKLYGVRLDTPSSRRGDLIKIVQEVKWEMKVRGIDARIIASGGMDEYSIPKLKKAGVDAFGVGTSVSNARTINFAMDIIEKEGEPVAKRGKFSGKKKVFRCPDCLNYHNLAWDTQGVPECGCGSEMEPILKRYLKNGSRTEDMLNEKTIRKNVLEQLEKVEINWIHEE